MKPCSKCGGEKPPGIGIRLCDACVRKPNVNSPRAPHKGCRRCGAAKSTGRGVKLCDDCRELGQWRKQAKSRARTAMHRKPCRGCGKPRGAVGKGAYCQACKRLRKHPPICARCGAPKASGAGRRLCDACPSVRERKPCVGCGGPKDPGVGRRLCNTCRAPKATRARRAELQRLDRRLQGAWMQRHAEALPYTPLSVRSARVAMVDATAFLEWFETWVERRVALVGGAQYLDRGDVVSIEEVCALSGFSPKRISDARRTGRIDYAKAEAFLTNAGCQEPWRVLQSDGERRAA